ncbi:hypothetical protein EVAR_6047_1 [Eumeta japonica]|uniref:Uncharacterized protein n=1 Tax=Eumeta variegata TaxID=151549 RepID=A0A4C1TAT4_EUMVA|nr:hypothetical protein EVAR_6047_1 [Eumeta japonica]
MAFGRGPLIEYLSGVGYRPEGGARRRVIGNSSYTKSNKTCNASEMVESLHLFPWVSKEARHDDCQSILPEVKRQRSREDRKYL